MRSLVVLSACAMLLAPASWVGAEPMPKEWFVELANWVAKVEGEVFAGADPAARMTRFEAAWKERGDYEARTRLLGLVPRLRGPESERFMIARLADEPNAAIRRVLVRYMGEIAAESYREPLAKACKEDPVTHDFMGGCIVTQGHARAEACAALEHLEEHMGDHLDEGGEAGAKAGWMEGKPE